MMSGPGLHFIGDEELREVVEVITSRQLSRYRYGEMTEQLLSKTALFEKEFGAAIGVKHCIAMNSCTSALLAALTSLRIGSGDEVLVPGYTFIATAAAVVHTGATPVLVEIDDSLTMDPSDLPKKITRRTRAVIPVHMLGAPCAMNEILKFAADHGLAVVEDVAQACGGSFQGIRLGALGHAGAFSLNVFKTITSGDGGILTTNDERLYNAAFSFHDHGYSPIRQTVMDSNVMFGLNLRMNELVGAVALAQVRKIDLILKLLRHNKAIFTEEIRGRVPVTFRHSNDQGGDCGTTMSCIFRSASVAQCVADSLGTITAIHSGKHYYGNMRQFSSISNHVNMPMQVGYRKGSLPQTDDILSRTVNLGVGVKDTYLGTSFGIEPFSTREDISLVADAFARSTAGLLST